MKSFIKVKSSTCVLTTVLFAAAQGCTGFIPVSSLHRHAEKAPGAPNRSNTQRRSKRTLTGPMNALPPLETIGNFYESSPYEAAFLTCAFKASAADVVAQVRQNAKKVSSGLSSNDASDGPDDEASIEFQRTLSFLLYGGLYQGCTQLYIYNHLFPTWFGDGADPHVVATKVLFDMVVLAPLLPLPFSYAVKSLIYEKPITQGLQKYVDDVKNQGLLIKYWSFWCPVQSLTFSVVPDHLRIPFMAAFSFVWLIVLSTIANHAPDAPIEGKDSAPMNAYKDQIRERLGAIAVTERDDEEKKAFAF